MNNIKRKSSGIQKRKKSSYNRTGSSSEDEWLCARTFKASKIDNASHPLPEPEKGDFTNTKTCFKHQTNLSTTEKSKPHERRSPFPPTTLSGMSNARGSIGFPSSAFSKIDVRSKTQQLEKALNQPSWKRKNVIEEVNSTDTIIPKLKSSTSVKSNASDVVPDSYNSSSSSVSTSSSKSSKNSSSSSKSKSMGSYKVQEKKFEKLCEKPFETLPETLLDSPVLPCTPIRTSAIRRISRVIDDIEVEPKPSVHLSPKLSTDYYPMYLSKRRNSIDILPPKTTNDSYSSSQCETPKRINRRQSLLNMKIEASQESSSPKFDQTVLIMETLDIESLRSRTSHEERIPEKVSIEVSQAHTSPIKPCVFKMPKLRLPEYEPSEPNIEESCAGFEIQETCHLGIAETSMTSARECFEIDEADGKSVRCDDYVVKPMSLVGPISQPRENQLNRKRLSKLAGRLAKHLSGVRCERLIVRRDPRAVIVSLPISETYSNWGLTFYEAAGNGQLIIIRDRASGFITSSRVCTSALSSLGAVDGCASSANPLPSIKPSTLANEKHVKNDLKVSKSRSIAPPASVGTALRAVVNAGTDSASSAAECWLHLAQPYSLIRTSSRQPPAIINPVLIDR